MAISSNNVQVYATLYQLRLHFYQHSKIHSNPRK